VLLGFCLPSSHPFPRFSFPVWERALTGAYSRCSAGRCSPVRPNRYFSFHTFTSRFLFFLSLALLHEHDLGESGLKYRGESDGVRSSPSGRMSNLAIGQRLSEIPCTAVLM